jgi:hypothetical protein
MSNTYEIQIDYQTPEDKELVDGLIAWGLWGEEERLRKQPHAIHTMEYEVKVPLTKGEAQKLKEHMKAVYEQKGGYHILNITIKELL